jgi:uncharacterized protein (DUF2141 family)
MKTLSLFLALFLTVSLCNSQTNGNTITVTVDNVLSNKGKVLFGLHTEGTFMKSKAIKNVESTINNSVAMATFKNVDKGTYAIMVLHDENDNKQMDFEDNGMPKENYAMSNNPMSYGPPQFTDAKFEVTDKNLDLQIRF